MPILLSAARTELENVKQDISDVSSTLFISWCNHINRMAYRHIAGIDPERFIQAQTFSNITSGAQALNANFNNIQPYGCGFHRVDSDGNDTEERLPLVPFGSQRQGYYLDNAGNVVFVKVEVATTYKLRYIANPTTFTALTDHFTLDKTVTGIEIIPDEFLLDLRHALDVMYTQWDEDLPAESFADTRFARALDEISRNIRRTPAVYPMHNLSSIF